MIRNLPGGFLVLDNDGTIEAIPPFLAEALSCENREDLCVFDLFDTAQIPHLSITRVSRHDETMTFHVQVVGSGLHRVFRYWDASEGDEIRFYFVDDSSIQQAHEWEYRKLRGSILGDLENFFSSQIDNRLTTIRALAEVMRSSPDLKNDAADRLFLKLEELESVIDQVSKEVRHSDESESFVALKMDNQDLEHILSAWSNEETRVDALIGPQVEGLDSTLMDRIIFPFVQNALESSSKNRKVLVEVERADHEYVEFEISDNGVGMTRHEILRAEDPFYTTKRGHLGMGIPRAVDRLNKMGGYWSMDSKRNQGTKVSIYIPHKRNVGEEE